MKTIAQQNAIAASLMRETQVHRLVASQHLSTSQHVNYMPFPAACMVQGLCSAVMQV